MPRAKRAFDLASPLDRGPDVKALQGAINKKYQHLQIDHRIKVDSEFGPKTLRAAREVAYAIGVGGKARDKLKRGRVSRGVQRLIRGGREKTRAERIRTLARAPWRKKLRQRYAKEPGEKALAWAKSKEGITESPAGSNWGPQISDWVTYAGYGYAVPWCGCFVCYAVVKVAGAKVPNRIRLGYTGYIVADARAGTNGLREVPFDQARAGDIVVFSFDHIGLVDHVRGSSLYTVEGNTSSGDAGSQSNGGGVFARVRHRGDVVLIARPSY